MKKKWIKIQRKIFVILEHLLLSRGALYVFLKALGITICIPFFSLLSLNQLEAFSNNDYLLAYSTVSW